MCLNFNTHVHNPLSLYQISKESEKTKAVKTFFYLTQVFSATKMFTLILAIISWEMMHFESYGA